MQKILTILNCKRIKFNKTSVTLCVALVYILVTIAQINADSIVPQEISRFIYKYYYILPNEKINSILTEELKKIYPDINTQTLKKYILKQEKINPGTLVRFIENRLLPNVNNKGAKFNYNIENLTQKEWMEYVENEELFLLYTSEDGRKAESSLGHLSLLYKKKGSKYFDTYVAFLASDFIDKKTGRPRLENYFKGAFTNLKGKFISYPFYDAIYENIIIENRTITIYKINIDKNKIKNISEKLWKITNSKDAKYNFFTANCASEVINIIPETDNIINRFSFKTPAKFVRLLEKENYIEYIGILRNISQKNNLSKIEFLEGDSYNRAQSSYNHNISITIDNKGNGLFSTSLFHFSRPYNGIVYQKTQLNIMRLEMVYNVKYIDLESIEPIKILYSPSVYKNLNIYFEYSLNYIENWSNIFKVGISFQLNNFKIRPYYKYNLWNDDEVILAYLYSNKFIDILIKNKNLLSKEKMILDLEAEIFINNILSLNLIKNIEEYSIGLTYYY